MEIVTLTYGFSRLCTTVIVHLDCVHVLLRLCFGLGGAAQLCEQLSPAAVEHSIAEEAGPARHLLRQHRGELEQI
jgi:hypothetical protein